MATADFRQLTAQTPQSGGVLLTRRALLGALGAGLFATGWALGRGRQFSRTFSAGPAAGVVPGEFEQQDAMLLSWPGPTHPCVHALGREILPSVDQFFVDVLAATNGKLRTICLVSGEQQRLRVVKVLKQANLSHDTVQFVQVPFVEPYPRDYGPLILKSFDGAHRVLDANYASYGRLPASESVPLVLARTFGMDLEHMAINFEGGNLLSNGSGLLVSSTALLDWNKHLHTTSSLTAILKQQLGATDVIFLEPLAGESSGHVDLFATFTAPDIIVVGEYSQDIDPINAAILDRNARRLAGLRTASGPLQVVRIPMPARVDKWWYTYANVAYANGVLLVPKYAPVDPELQERAFETYRQLLPGWKIVGIEAASMYPVGGSLHCLTLNLYRV